MSYSFEARSIDHPQEIGKPALKWLQKNVKNAHTWEGAYSVLAQTCKDTNAPFYDWLFRETHQFAYEELVHAIGFIEGGFQKMFPLQTKTRLIDLGCGTGILTRKLSDTSLFDEVVGIDLHDDMIRAAQTHSQRSNITYMVADAMQLDKENPNGLGYFDVVVCNGLVPYIGPAHYKQLINQMARVLKPFRRLYMHVSDINLLS